MAGGLAEGVLPDLLREIYLGRRNGWLRLTRGGEQQSLRFRRGHIVNAHTNVIQERLGEMLVRRGHLSQTDLERATEIVVRDRRKLGEVLAELGLMDASGLEDAIALHVHDLLAKVFAWTDGSYEFEEEEETPGGEVTLKLSTGELILEAVKAIRDPDVVRKGIGDPDAVLAPSSDPLLRFQKLTLSPSDGFVLSRVDGMTAAREIVQMIPLAPEDVERSLLGLLSTGAIEPVRGMRRPRPAGREASPAAERPPARQSPPPQPPPQQQAPAGSSAAPPPPPAANAPATAPAPMAAASGRAEPQDEKVAERRREIQEAADGIGRNHFEVLGLSRAVSEAEVKDAYFRLAKRFHPDVHHATALADLHSQLESVFRRVTEAYEVLRDARRRADYEAQLGRSRGPATARPGPEPPAAAAVAEPGARPSPRPEPPPDPEEIAHQAEDAIRRAAKLHEKEQYWDAIQLLEPVVEKASGRLRAFGKVLLARCYLKNPKWARKAEELLLGVTREDPKTADAWALLGQIYVGKGMQARALSMYRKALELRPEHEEAAQYVAAHTHAGEDTDEPEESGGFLRRLFRK